MSRLAAAVLFFVTLVYLGLEVAFNARLLDVAANPMDNDAVHGIEFWGRIISGVALALMIAASLVTQAAKGQIIPFFHWAGDGNPWSPRKLLGWIAATSVIAVAGAFYIEKDHVNREAEKQSAQTLHDAAFAVAIAQYVQNGGEVEKIPLSPEILGSPEGKAFSAMFAPYYVNVISHLPNRRAILTDVLNDYQEQVLPGDVLYGAYARYAKGAQSQYNDRYINGVKTYYDSMEAIPGKAEKAYDQFVAQLGEYGYTPDTVPEDMKERVRSEAQQKFGITLPADWVASDRDTFQARMAAKIQDGIEGGWHSKAVELDVEGLPPTLTTFNAFFLSKPIQARLRKELKDSYDMDLTRNLPPRMNQADFEKRVYAPLMKDYVARQIVRIDAAPDQYARGGDRHCNGVENYKALMLPGFAMLVSLLGIFYHSRKLAMYAWAFIAEDSSSWARRLVTLVLPVVLCLIPLTLPPGPIRASEGYHKLSSVMHEMSPGMKGHVYDWVIRAQPAFYPLSSAIHKNLFGNTPFMAGKSVDACAAATS